MPELSQLAFWDIDPKLLDSMDDQAALERTLNRLGNHRAIVDNRIKMIQRRIDELNGKVMKRKKRRKQSV